MSERDPGQGISDSRRLTHDDKVVCCFEQRSKARTDQLMVIEKENGQSHSAILPIQPPLGNFFLMNSR
jgi:hypothetical protein